MTDIFLARDAIIECTLRNSRGVINMFLDSIEFEIAPQVNAPNLQDQVLQFLDLEGAESTKVLIVMWIKDIMYLVSE